MSGIMSLWARLTGMLSGTIVESIALFLTRVALAGIFWRSYKTKVEADSWFTITDTQYFLFENEFTGLPIPSDLAVPLTTYAEFLFPVLLVLGLFSRFSAVALAVMALVIQLFVFPTWDHFFGWDITVLALAGIIISRGPGTIGIDKILSMVTGSKAA